MKKVVAGILIIVVVVMALTIFMPQIYATNSNTLSVDPYVSATTGNNETSDAKSEIVDMKHKTSNELKEYEELYGSRTYGYTAYALNKIRIFSIPLCFLGIAVGSIYQYVIGIRKMDIRDRGFALIIGFVTILVICQLLPLIFAIVVQGWRG